MKDESIYLSSVFVLTIRHLQHSVYLHVVRVEGLLFHLREVEGNNKEERRSVRERINPSAHAPSGARDEHRGWSDSASKNIQIYASQMCLPAQSNRTERTFNIHVSTQNLHGCTNLTHTRVFSQEITGENAHLFVVNAR